MAEINIQEGLKDQPVVDAALIAKDSSEMKEASLSDDPNTGINQDEKFEVVDEEENKADEESNSELPLQNRMAE